MFDVHHFNLSPRNISNEAYSEVYPACRRLLFPLLHASGFTSVRADLDSIELHCTSLQETRLDRLDKIRRERLLAVYQLLSRSILLLHPDRNVADSTGHAEYLAQNGRVNLLRL